MTSSRAVEDCRMLSCIVYDTSSGSWFTGTPAGPPSYTPVGVYPGHADDPRSGKGIRVAPSPTHLTLAVARTDTPGFPGTHQWVCIPTMPRTLALARASVRHPARLS